MKTAPSLLYVMRHGEATETGGRDHERPLTEKGRRDSQNMGRKIMSGFTVPDRMVVSSARRTRQTAACLVLTPTPEMIVSEKLYNGDEQIYLDEICWQSPASVLVIGHNPSVHQLLYRICKPARPAALAPAPFPAAALAVVELLPPLCLRQPPSGRLIDFLIP